MKTSNKFIIAALVVIFVFMIGYDLLLKAEYQSGSYKIPYKNYVALTNKDFDIVDIHSSTAANVKFVQGPFSIRVDDNALEYVRVSQDGARLRIEANFEGNYRGNINQYILVISCPTLSEVNSNATYRSNNQEVTDTIVREDWHMRQVLIEGFKQDSMSIVQDYGSTVLLEKNQIRVLNAVVGKSSRSGSNLIIQEGNQFETTHLDIRNYSKLFLDNSIIHSFNYKLADGAKLIVSGKAQNLLNQSTTH